MGSARRFNETYHEQLCELAKLGLSQHKTAALAGISQSTLSTWLRDNEQFRRDYKQANASRLKRIADNVLREAEDDPKIGLEVLRVQDPEAWMRREGRELTGRDGGPVRAEVTATEPRHEELAASVGQLLRESSEPNE